MIPHLIRYQVLGFEMPNGTFELGVEIETDLPLCPTTPADHRALRELLAEASAMAMADGSLRVQRVVRRT